MSTRISLAFYAVLILVVVGIGLTLRFVIGTLKAKRMRNAARREVAARDEPVATDGSVPPRPRPAMRPPAAPHTGRIFVAYRRSDSRHITGRIYDRLAEHFGPERVLRDVDSFPLGVDFRESAAGAISSCSVALVVIGSRFLEREADGRRIDVDTDHLRIELRSILDKGIPLIPVLVDGAAVPERDDLPEDVSSIAYRNGVEIREDPYFRDDVQRLIAGVDRIVS